MKSFIRDQGGTALAENAVFMMIYLYIIFMGMVFSLAFWAKIVAYDAVREGARYQALGQGPALVKVNEVLSDGLLQPANIQALNVVEAGSYITVTITYLQPSYLPLIPTLLGQNPLSENFSINAGAVFKKET